MILTLPSKLQLWDREKIFCAMNILSSKIGNNWLFEEVPRPLDHYECFIHKLNLIYIWPITNGDEQFIINFAGISMIVLGIIWWTPHSCVYRQRHLHPINTSVQFPVKIQDCATLDSDIMCCVRIIDSLEFLQFCAPHHKWWKIAKYEIVPHLIIILRVVWN